MEPKVNGMDKLDLLKVREERVLVGEREMKLRTSTLMQQRGLVHAMGRIEPGPLFEAARPIAAASVGGDFVSTLLSAGPELYRRLTEFLMVAGGDALAEGTAALLDNDANFQGLVSAAEVDSGDAEREGKRYIGSAALRAWVAGSITPRQAFHVLTVAVRLNDYAALGEVLAGLARKAAGSASPAGLSLSPPPSNPPATASSDSETGSSPTTQLGSGSQG